MINPTLTLAIAEDKLTAMRDQAAEDRLVRQGRRARRDERRDGRRAPGSRLRGVIVSLRHA